MRYAFLILTVISLSVAVTSITIGQEATLSTADLIQGILVRAENPFSGQMIYRLNQGFPGSKKPEVENTLTFSGSSWRLKSQIKASEVEVMRQQGDKLVEYKGPPLQGFLETDTVSHHGKYVELKRTPQDNASVRSVAHIDHQKPIIPESFPYPPVFAGTFWYEDTKKFIAAHKEKAVRKKEAEVNGVLCQVIEWDVSPSEKFSAFHSVGELTNQGGILRVYVAPGKAYALPCVEYVGRSGKIASSFDSWDFQEYGGIFIPHRCRLQLYSSKGPGFFLEYQFDKIKSINQMIPDSEFVLPLPPGTHVSDGRPGKESIMFDIKKEGPIPPDLEDIITIATPRFWGWNWHTAFLLGLAVGLGVLGLFLLRRRLFRQRRHA